MPEDFYDSLLHQERTPAEIHVLHTCDQYDLALLGGAKGAQTLVLKQHLDRAPGLHEHPFVCRPVLLPDGDATATAKALIDEGAITTKDLPVGGAQELSLTLYGFIVLANALRRLNKDKPERVFEALFPYFPQEQARGNHDDFFSARIIEDAITGYYPDEGEVAAHTTLDLMKREEFPYHLFLEDDDALTMKLVMDHAAEVRELSEKDFRDDLYELEADLEELMRFVFLRTCFAEDEVRIVFVRDCENNEFAWFLLREGDADEAIQDLKERQAVRDHSNRLRSAPGAA